MSTLSDGKRLIVYGKHPFAAEEDDELSFQPADPILVLETDELYNDGWWKGQTRDGRVGLFPVNFVEELPTRRPDQWSIIDVVHWLESAGFSAVVGKFQDHEITGDILLDLNLSSLRELGVENLGDRINILHSILELKESQSKDSAYVDDFVVSPPRSPPMQQNDPSLRSEPGKSTSYYGDLYDEYDVEDPMTQQQLQSKSKSPGSSSASSARYDEIDDYLDSYNVPSAQLHPGSPVSPRNKATSPKPSPTAPIPPIPSSAVITGSPGLMRNGQNSVNSSTSSISAGFGSNRAANFGSPDYEGWLHVKIGTDRAWKKRWCILKARCLYVMKDRPPSKALAQIALDAGATILPDPKAPKNKYAFMASAPDTPTFRFLADTQLGMVSWISVMVRAGQKRSSRGPVPLLPIKHAGKPARTPILDGFKLQYSSLKGIVGWKRAWDRQQCPLFGSHHGPKIIDNASPIDQGSSGTSLRKAPQPPHSRHDVMAVGVVIRMIGAETRNIAAGSLWMTAVDTVFCSLHSTVHSVRSETYKVGLSRHKETSEATHFNPATMASETRTDIITLTHHILSQQQTHKDATGDLTILLNAIASACKWVANCVRKAELLKVIGLTGGTNVQEEKTQKLDILSNEIMINLLKASGRTALLVSEENAEAIIVEDKYKGNYCVVFDPLDGSSNIDCGVSIGTIFGIYRLTSGSKGTIADVLQPGTEMVAAGYCMYGSSTVLVLTTGPSQLHGYTLDPSLGEFVLTHANIRIGKKRIYSINEGNAFTFDAAVKSYISSLKFPPEGHTGTFNPYTARYVGSMVADVHRTLLYGGIFMYPSAKLRVLYECFPMSLIVEAAGGKASDGRRRILDLVPDMIHSRSGIFLGTAAEVDAIEIAYRKMDGGKI
ncbi:fructose-bisphosphatase [Synchytrium endobioticum]|uniref:fructose-bisphosphatase n=1 Tax=Synchytrium endobioticum TaxID=286115 RepID=A0A507DCM0_9FUNG|nr:fructose-bisphosphatase [Synchytrium endobioticum]